MRFRIILAILTFAFHANAELITFEFSGVTTYWSAGGFGLDNIANAPTVGTPFSGTFHYDFAATDLDHLSANGRYSSGDGPNIFVTVGEHTFSGRAGVVDVRDGATDSFSLHIHSLSDLVFSSLLPIGIGEMRISLSDTSGLALSSDTLPDQIDVNQWTSAVLSFGAHGAISQEYGFSGEITSISRVPDSGATASLLAGCLFGLGLLRLRLKTP